MWPTAEHQRSTSRHTAFQSLGLMHGGATSAMRLALCLSLRTCLRTGQNMLSVSKSAQVCAVAEEGVPVEMVGLSLTFTVHVFTPPFHTAAPPSSSFFRLCALAARHASVCSQKHFNGGVHTPHGAVSTS
eukprot:7383679-Prymnesium_polylepis.1